MSDLKGTIQVIIQSKSDYRIVSDDKYTELIIPVSGTDVIVSIPRSLIGQLAADIIGEVQVNDTHL